MSSSKAGSRRGEWPRCCSNWSSPGASASSRASASCEWVGDKGERGGEEVSGDRGVTHEGQDDPEVSGLEVRRQGLHGARARSAKVEARGGREEELQARLQSPAREEEGPRRAQEGGVGRGGALHRHRPRP